MATKKANSKTKRKTTTTATKRKTTTKLATTKKTNLVVKDPLTKGGIVTAITDMTSLAKKDVTSMLDALGNVIESHIKSRGPGKFVLPGLMKINVVKKPARPARKGINPFTGEEVMFKAKPARKVVKIKALKKLKEMVD